MCSLIPLIRLLGKFPVWALTTFVMLLGVVATVQGAISFDAQSSTSAVANATSVTWAHTVGTGANRMLVVGVTTEGSSDRTVTGVTWGAQALTQGVGSRAVTTTTFSAVDLWYLAAPAVGTNNITVTFSGSVSNGTVCGAVSLFGVAQSAPSAVAATNYSSATGTAYSLGISALSADWLVDVVTSSASSAFSPGGGLTERWDVIGGSNAMRGACATRLVTATGTVTDTWSAGNGKRAHTIAAFRPAPGPPETYITAPDSASYISTNSYTISAVAVDDGSVTNVAFYEDGNLLGNDTTSPFGYTRFGATAGAHVVTAVATDNLGNTTTSPAVNITVQSPIAVGAGGSANFTFDNYAATSQWATGSVAGGSRDLVSPESLDSGVSAVSYTSINSALASGVGGSLNALALWRSNDQRIQTSPTGVRMTLLMAPLVNTSGGDIDDLVIKYTLALTTGTPDELIKGRRIYWSKTGAGGSWTLAGEDSLTTNGTTEVAIYLTSLAWTNGGSLFILWADDNGVGTDAVYTMDGVTFTQFTGPAVTITKPVNGSTMGTDLRIEALAATSSGTVTGVSFYDGVTLLGTDTTAPYTYEFTGATAGNRTLTAVAQDSNSLSATSAAVTITAAAGSGTLTRGPYLQMANSTSMTIRWRTTQSTLGRVNYGLVDGTLNMTQAEAAIPNWPYDHVVTLTGLTPNTPYFYSIGTAANTLANGPEYTFHTSPVPGTATNTRIWVVGDCGRGDTFQENVRDAYYAWTGARTPDFCLMLGDNAYDSGNDAEYQLNYFAIYPAIFRKMPQWSTVGNHETENGSTDINAKFPYFEMFTFPTAGECGGVPSGTERYFSFDYGNIHVVNLDSQISSRAVDNPATTGVNEDGPMAAWLRQDLASTTKTWIIAMFHHPPYSKGSHDSDAGGPGYDVQMGEMRERFNPILEEGGVDLVLLGHSHSYERSILLDGHYGLSNTLTNAMKKNAGSGRPSGTGAYIKPLTGPRDRFGAVYTVAGSSGRADGGSLNHPVMYVSYNTGGTMNIDIDGNRLDATYVEKKATAPLYTTPDTFTILKQGAADSDGDGMPDEYEILHGLNRKDPADALLDQDGDGNSNLKEYVFSTAHAVPDTYTFSTSYDAGAGTATVTYNTVVGRSYRVWYSPDLLDWQPGSSSAIGTGSALSWTDDGTTTGTAPSQELKRFYRIEATVIP